MFSFFLFFYVLNNNHLLGADQSINKPNRNRNRKQGYSQCFLPE